MKEETVVARPPLPPPVKGKTLARRLMATAMAAAICGGSRGDGERSGHGRVSVWEGEVKAWEGGRSRDGRARAKGGRGAAPGAPLRARWARGFPGV